MEGQISFLRNRIEDAKKKAAIEPTVNVSYKDVKNIIAAVEGDVERVVNKDDVQTLRRALSDIVHKLRQFLSRVGAGGSSLATEREETDLEELLKQKLQADKELKNAADAEEEAEKNYSRIKTDIEAEASESRAAEREMFRIVNEQKEYEAKLAQLDHELSVIERDREEFKRELQEAVALLGRDASNYQSMTVNVEEVVSEDREVQRERRRELEKMKIRLEEFGGANDDIEKEYKEVKERDDFLVREITDLNSSVLKLESLIKELSDKLNERFVSGIEKIGTEFDRFFTLMFDGGSAALKQIKLKKRITASQDSLLEDDEDEAAARNHAEDTQNNAEDSEVGIEIDVKLPNKRIKGLDMLSGGERALTSIALIFAMSQVNPPLFIILDETDAALDEANSRRYGDMIEALAKKSQLILITHNRETMSRAGILYGVTMSGDGVSKLLSVKFDEAVQVAK